MDFCIAFLLFFFLSHSFHCAIMVNKIMKQPESQKSKIHNLDKTNNNNAQVVCLSGEEREGRRGVVHTALLLVYYYGAAITSSMHAPWSNAEDLGKTATRSGVEQTRKRIKE